MPVNPTEAQRAASRENAKRAVAARKAAAFARRDGAEVEREGDYALVQGFIDEASDALVLDADPGHAALQLQNALIELASVALTAKKLDPVRHRLCFHAIREAELRARKLAGRR
jgi:hypothetical protein